MLDLFMPVGYYCSGTGYGCGSDYGYRNGNGYGCGDVYDNGNGSYTHNYGSEGYVGCADYCGHDYYDDAEDADFGFGSGTIKSIGLVAARSTASTAPGRCVRTDYGYMYGYDISSGKSYSVALAYHFKRIQKCLIYLCRWVIASPAMATATATAMATAMVTAMASAMVAEMTTAPVMAAVTQTATVMVTDPEITTLATMLRRAAATVMVTVTGTVQG